MKNTLIIVLIFSLSSVGFSQGIARQSINSMGGSSTINNTLVESSVGQPYQTEINKESSIVVRPGFIQPRTMNIEQIKSETTIDLTIYPNPTTESFTISSDESIESAKIHIMDAAGNLVNEINLEQFRSHSVDCSTWNNGSYFITTLTDDGRKNNSKLLITK